MTSDRASLLSIGPCGLGRCYVVPKLPSVDSGTIVERSFTIPVWDCASVAYALRDVTRATLLTNQLGNGFEAIALRGRLGENVELIEIGPATSRCPEDVILLERETCSRRWLTTNYFPNPSIMFDDIAVYLETANQAPLLLYLEAASPPLGTRTVIERLAELLPAHARAVLNFGDISGWEAVADTAIWDVCTDGAVLQWSLPETPRASALRTFLASPSGATLAAKECSLLLTLGASGGIVVTGAGVEHIKVTAVKDAVTVGAGGVASAELLRGMLSDSRTGLPNLARRALLRATDYVKALTVDNRCLGLDL